jgi:RNA polymerase sigma factor (sigma-70 family)
MAYNLQGFIIEYLIVMTNLRATPRNSNELWKKHLKWYILLYLEQQQKIKWHVKYDPPDQRGWDALIDDPSELWFDAPIENPDEKKSAIPVNDLYEVRWYTSERELEKDWSTYIDPLSIYFIDLRGKYSLFKDLICEGSLLNREQEFWLGIDIQAGLRLSQVISSERIFGVMDELKNNWDQYSAMIKSLRLPSIDWDRAVSEIAQQRLNKERVRFTEFFKWLEDMNDHTEIRKKISWHATRIYLDLIILPVIALSMLIGNFSKDGFVFPNWNEIDHRFNADPTIEWLIDEIFTLAIQAREQLVVSNLKLVRKIAGRYRGRGVEFADLIQQGNLGLMHSIDNYDPSRGCKFSTYAVPWIKKKIMRYIDDYSGIVRLPERVSLKKKLVKKTSERLYQQLHRTPTESDIAVTLDSTTAAVATLLNFERIPKSLDEPVDESDDYVLEDIIEELAPIDLVNVVDQGFLAKVIQSVLNELPDDQRNVITLRFGFDGQERTFKEVGDTLGVPWELIRKIEFAALKSLRHSARSNLLRKYLD